MTNTIKFIARDEYGWKVQNKPVPASTLIPSWWKEMTPYSVDFQNPEGKFVIENRTANATFKKCTPMLDAITSGYIVTLWADVQVRSVISEEDGKYYPRVTWRVNYPLGIFSQHGQSSQKIRPPFGYSNIVFKYQNTWIPRTPPGYSVLITKPFGYQDLPFYAIPGIVDSDKSQLEILPPMWVKKDFEGIVEAGTPLFQITPFKRNNWKSEFDYHKDNEYHEIEDKNFNKHLIGHYIKNVWSKKSYK